MDGEIEFEAYSNLTAIQRFFYGQSVFLTGVTGLLGKVVLEKLLRCCPGIGMIYVHMRPKKGLTSQERLEKIFKIELFNVLKEVFPQFRKKVQVVEGDITGNKLGLSFEDYEKIRQNVTIVIHSAASVNFNDPIKSAMDHNVKSVKNILDLAHDIPNIKSIVHVSTSFVKREADGTVLEEIPKMKVSPQQLSDALQWLDDKSAESVSDYLTENKFLTTYLITKALAEILIDQERGDLPVAIVRPSYISPTWKDPFPGWVDTIQGISGLLLAGAKGVLRTLLSVKGLKLNIIPADFVSNAIIASSWHIGTTRPTPLFIMNVTFDFEDLPLGDEELLAFVLKKRDDYPLVNMFRYPDFTVYYNKYAYTLHAVIDQWIPAVIIDSVLFVATGKTILIKVYKKITFLYDIFYRLGKDKWECKTDNINMLRNSMSTEDLELFSFQMSNFNWEDYIDVCLQGGRQFLARESATNIPYAKKKAKIWYGVTTLLKWCIILFFLYYLFSRTFFSSIYENFEEKLYPLHP